MTAGKTTYEFHAPVSEEIFKVKSEAIGMLIDEEKTQMFCIHPKGEDMQTFVSDSEGNTIKNMNKFKNLCFTFGPTHDASLNTDTLVRNFSMKL